MAAKKKTAKKPTLLARTKAERDEAAELDRQLVTLRRQLAESEAARQHWCEIAVAREQRAELAEDALRQLLEASQRARPSVPLVIAQAPQISGLPHPTLGEPGDPGRYSREARP